MKTLVALTIIQLCPGHLSPINVRIPCLWKCFICHSFGNDKEIGLQGMFCCCHKGKAMSALLFFLVAIYTFSAHFNLFGSWSGGMWPCPSVTSARVPVVNMKPRHGFSNQREDQALPPHTNTL